MILVVEDNDTLRAMMVALLRRHGYEAFGAEDGDTALAAMHLLAPTLVLLDLVLPGMHGWELRRRMLETPELRLIPVILTTGVPLNTESCQALRVKASLEKPISGAKLLACIGKLLPRLAEAAE